MRNPHAITQVSAGTIRGAHSDDDAWMLSIQTANGISYRFNRETAKEFFGADMPKLGDDLSVFALMTRNADRISSGMATMRQVGDDWIMTGITGTHRLSVQSTGYARLRAHWQGFVAMNPAPKEKRRAMLRSPNYPQWKAASHEVNAMLGLAPKQKLPREGIAPRLIQGITVYVAPLNPDRKQRAPHRVRIICPHCGRHISAGRAHQHVCK